MRILLSIVFSLGAVLISAPAQAAPPAKAPAYAQVRAILAQRCLSCHDAKEAEGELVMQTFASLMKGGEKGPDIVPGKADASRLISQLEHKSKPFMPPPKKAEPVPAEEIAIIRAWIDAGAIGPGPGEDIAIAPATRPVAKIIPKVAVRRPVLSLAYEPKLKIAAAARPGEVEIWSVDRQAVVRTFAKLAGDVNAVTFSADGNLLIAAGGDPGVKGRIWIWNVADWSPVRTLEGHADAIYSLAISTDGKTLATGSYDQKITLWNVADGKPIQQLLGHNGAVFGVAFRNDNKVLASISADRTLKLWELPGGKRLDTRPEPQKDQYGVIWSPDGTRVAAVGVDNRIRVWKVSPSAVEGTNTLIYSQFAHEGSILRIAWSSDGKWILSSADDNTVRLFDANDISQKLTFPKQSDWPSALTFAGEKTAIVGRIDGSLGFYDTVTGKEIPAPKPVAAAKPVLASPWPRGVERGQTAKIKLIGKDLADITSIKIAGAAGITAKLLPGAKADEAWGEITTPADAPVGEFSLSVVGPGGESMPVKLSVDNLPQVIEQAKNDSPGEAQLLSSLPVSAWGQLMPVGDADYFAFDAAKGQNIVLDVAAKRLGSKAQVQLTLSDSSGMIVATASGTGEDTDPLLAFTAPAAGRYTVKVADLATTGAADSFYRLSIGSFAYVTGTFPLAVAAGSETKVQLIGHDLPKDAWVNVKAPAAAGEAEVPVDGGRFRSRRAMKVIVSDTPELLEVEPNDKPPQAMAIQMPSSVSGRIDAPGDADLYRFPAKAGITYVIETMAARRGSPVDTKIQILDTTGRPVPRMQLRAVRDSNITFRGFDSSGGGARFPNYLEMDLDQYIYMNGEVVRLFRYPEGPDSEFGFYAVEGKRRCYFDTTATAHALDEKVYVVEPHPIGEKLPVNGLPVFPIYYENDDEGNRLLGTDSRVHFTAPADGEYLVRVTDTRSFGGDAYIYRLTVRPARPDFTAMIEGYAPAIPAGGGKSFTVKLNRIDGFDGPVRVEISAPPNGFLISSPIVVEAGQWSATGTLYATPTTKPAAADKTAQPLKVTASAAIDGKPATRTLADLPAPSATGASQVFVWLEPVNSAADGRDPSAPPQPIVITPGKLTPAWLRVQRNGYAGRLTFDSQNLPYGVGVADVGLNGILIPEGQNQRQIFVQCAPWVGEVQRPWFLRVRELDTPTTPPVPLQVHRPEAAATAR